MTNEEWDQLRHGDIVIRVRDGFDKYPLNTKYVILFGLSYHQLAKYYPKRFYAWPCLDGENTTFFNSCLTDTDTNFDILHIKILCDPWKYSKLSSEDISYLNHSRFNNIDT